MIVETVKPLEQKTGSSPEKGFILRLYEAEGAADTVTLNFGVPVKGLALTNMLEEVQQKYDAAQQLTLEFRPFEIKTLKVNY